MEARENYVLVVSTHSVDGKLRRFREDLADYLQSHCADIIENWLSDSESIKEILTYIDNMVQKKL